MIECKECNDYVDTLFQRGDITKDEIEKVTIDRHVLRGCAQKANRFLEWLEFSIKNQQHIDAEATPFPCPPWNKGYMEALLDCKERYLDILNSKSIEL